MSTPTTAGGFRHPARNATPPGSPKMASAVKACAAKLQLRRFVPNHATISRYVACVRAHGYNMPSPNFNGGPIFPASVRTSSKFQAASRACLRQLLAHPPG